MRGFQDDDGDGTECVAVVRTVGATAVHLPRIVSLFYEMLAYAFKRVILRDIKVTKFLFVRLEEVLVFLRSSHPEPLDNCLVLFGHSRLIVGSKRATSRQPERLFAEKSLAR